MSVPARRRLCRAPRADLATLAARLRPALDDAMATVRMGGRLLHARGPAQARVPALTAEVYPIETGTPHTTGGRTFAAAEFEDNIVEEQVPHLTALHAH